MADEVGMTVLLVDDEPLILRSMAQALRGEGYEALAASTAREALALAQPSKAGAQRPRVDLLITDILMPTMSGHALVREMRKSRPDLTVLFISGSPVEPAESGAQSSGDAVLLKPFGLADLLGEVRKLIGPPTAPAALATLAAPASEQDLRSR